MAFPAAPSLVTNAGQWLRERPGSGAVICLPMNVFAGNTACMLQSIEHGRAVVNGYSGARPPFFEAIVDAMSRAPGPESLLSMHELGVEYVVSDRPLTIGATGQSTGRARGVRRPAGVSAAVVARDRIDLAGGD